MPVPDGLGGTKTKKGSTPPSSAANWAATQAAIAAAGGAAAGSYKGQQQGGYPSGFNYNDWAAGRAASQQAQQQAALNASRGGSRGGGRGRRGGYGGYGGGGGRDLAAEEEARKAAARALVEQLYAEQVGRATSGRDEALGVLPGYLQESLGRLGTINTQNVQAGQLARGNISRDQAATQALLQQAYGAGERDLQAQGVNYEALQGAGQMYTADAAARATSAQNWNDRLNAIMALGYGNQQAAASQVNQGAQGNLQVNFQEALNELQRQRTQSLMGLV